MGRYNLIVGAATHGELMGWAVSHGALFAWAATHGELMVEAGTNGELMALPATDRELMGLAATRCELIGRTASATVMHIVLMPQKAMCGEAVSHCGNAPLRAFRCVLSHRRAILRPR